MFWKKNILENRTSRGVNRNPLQEGYYNRNNPLVEGVPQHIHRPSPARWRPVNTWGTPSTRGINMLYTGCPHIFTGIEYSYASVRGGTYLPIVQCIGLQYSVLLNSGVTQGGATLQLSWTSKTNPWVLTSFFK